jgi:hypothetical protein
MHDRNSRGDQVEMLIQILKEGVGTHMVALFLPPQKDHCIRLRQDHTQMENLMQFSLLTVMDSRQQHLGPQST